MNVVVVGGGTPGKFGNDVVKRLRNDGHRVLVMSHKQHGATDSIVANFSSLEKTIDSFNQLTTQLDHIDILLYNTNCDAWPNMPGHYTSTAEIKEKLYIHGFEIQVVIPHALAIEALKKMSVGSRIIFMTTDMIYDKERTIELHRVGYAGGKSYQHQLMLGLSKHNDKDVIVSSISPLFNYNEPSKYKLAFDKAYNYIITHDASCNGKVFNCWEDYED